MLGSFFRVFPLFLLNFRAYMCVPHVNADFGTTRGFRATWQARIVNFLIERLVFFQFFPIFFLQFFVQVIACKCGHQFKYCYYQRDVLLRNLPVLREAMEHVEREAPFNNMPEDVVGIWVENGLKIIKILLKYHFWLKK